MRQIQFKAVGIDGKPLGTRIITLGSSTGNTFSSETVNNNKNNKN